MSGRTRRIAAAISAAMGALAVTISALPLIWEPQTSAELAAPMLIPRPIVTAVLLAVPAAVASIAVIRRSRLMLVTAGLLALFQSFVAFSGVTLGFLVPALLLIVLGVRAGESDDRSRPSWRQLATGVLVIGLVVSAWLVVLGTSETVCWIARLGPDGTPIYRQIPVTDTISVAPSEIGGGCDSGVPTAAGLLTGGVLILGALALAWLGSAAEIPAKQRTD
jgi:hypothetical protein